MKLCLEFVSFFVVINLSQIVLGKQVYGVGRYVVDDVVEISVDDVVVYVGSSGVVEIEVVGSEVSNVR